MQPDENSRAVKTTSKSLEILEKIKNNSGIGPSELIEDMDLSRNSIHRHLNTLRDSGYIIKEGGEYRLGMKLFHMGQHAKRRRFEYDIVTRELEQISEEISFEVDFSVEEQGRVIVIIDKTGVSQRAHFQLGEFFYMHTAASGKAILAELTDEKVNKILDRWGLPKQTESTITDRDQLFAELDTVGSRGYATNNEETNTGIQATASVIQTPQNSILGAISISGPTYRYPPHQEIAETLISKKEQMEDAIKKAWQRQLKNDPTES